MKLKFRRMLSVALINFFQGTHFYAIKRILLKFGRISVGENVRIVGPFYIGTVAKLTMGNNCFVGREFKVYGNGTVNIGDNVDIAPDVCLLTGSHEIGTQDHRAGCGIAFSINICDGCWIGAGTTIVGDTTIQTGSVVGAGSVVTRDIEMNTLAVGVPAKTIKKLTK